MIPIARMNRTVGTRSLALVAAGLGLSSHAAAWAAEQAAAAPPAIDTGDTAWVLTASALVLMMTLPGLALFYGGLVRAKNILNVLMQCFVSAGVVGVLWILVGYSLAFGTGNEFIGDFSKVGLSGVTLDSVTANFASPPRNIPEYVFIMFQAMFAIITPALILGAVAERMKFGAWVAFIAIWLLAVYCPIGAGLLWTGWFGFNAGSALSASPLATLAFLNTSTAASTAVLAWALIEWLHRGKPTALGGATAAVAGLVAITPACGNVSPMGAILVGGGVSVVSYLACTFLKPALGYDDSLDVFGVNALGGAWGALASGLFAVTLGSGIESNAQQTMVQLQGIAFVIVFAPLATAA